MQYDTVRHVDPAAADALAGEVDRQRETLSMIASENHVSEAVLEAQSSVLTNKYAEGYPDSRYYGGCAFADEIEQLAIDRAKELWGQKYVNVQPHSGSQANMGVYNAVLEAGDKILSLDLTHGGHLSHGHSMNFAGRVYEVEHYEVNPETGRLDFDAVREKAETFDPDLIISGFSAYPREVDWTAFQSIADAVDAYHLADIAHITGLVAAGVHTSPVGVADFVTGSTHKAIRAGRGGIIIADEDHGDAIDRAIIPGIQGGPLMHNIAGKAVGFKEALQPHFQEYAERTVTNAQALSDELKQHGFSLVSGGTDNHLVLVDLRDSHPETTGKAAEEALQDTGIVLNANTVPGETRSPFVTSGIRIGTPAVTTRGFESADCRTVARCIARVIDNIDDDTVKTEAAETVQQLCAEHPIYNGGLIYE
ncbi:MAG: serine hydroxymethyltransferase [Halobacteriales archaeon]